jgi:uridine kinase
MVDAAVVLPFTAGKSMDDVSLLAKSRVLAHLGIKELGVLLDALDQVALAPGTTIFREGDAGEHMYFVLDGTARARRGALDLAQLGRGDHFGELAILGASTRSTTVHADTAVRLARLSRSAFLSLAANHPSIALRIAEGLATSLASALTAMTDDVGHVLRQRTVPRRANVRVMLGDAAREVSTGAAVGTLLPRTIEGALVVAATIDHKAVSLDTAVSSDAHVEPLTVASWEGRRVYRSSVGLLLLEAARRVHPGATVSVGARRADGQLVHVEGEEPTSEWIGALEQEMRELAGSALPIRDELWTVEEARARLHDQGWADAACLLPFQRDRTVTLLSCGGTFALGLGPIVPNASALSGFSLSPHKGQVLLWFGAQLDPHVATRTSFLTAQGDEVKSGPPAVMVQELRAWLGAMGISSVGRFNESCVTSQVNELIHVSEGFHEKHIGRIADRIAGDRRIRVAAIAGPSSSGKTTFIKRLEIQLEVNGIIPVRLSLDDYYVDRERTPRDEQGEYDFEAVEAIDLALFDEHVRRLIAGERVKTPRYDFKAGRSVREDGPEVSLGAANILLVEGLHALSPRIFGACGSREQSFRVFVHPATGLPFDRLTSVLAEDVRLVRRIVRDRHQRGYTASQSIARWPSVRRGEERHVFTCMGQADVVFDSSLVYELAVLRVYAERYLLEISEDDPTYVTGYRLRQLIDRFVPIHADRVPATSILREFIGGSDFAL